MSNVQYNYNEDRILNEVFEYITSTYGQHYANDSSDIQLFDYWQSLGIMSTIGRATAMKYLARFGKKNGNNRKDLLKAIHYIVLALWAEDLDASQVEPESEVETPVDQSQFEEIAVTETEVDTQSGFEFLNDQTADPQIMSFADFIRSLQNLR